MHLTLAYQCLHCEQVGQRCCTAGGNPTDSPPGELGGLTAGQVLVGQQKELPVASQGHSSGVLFSSVIDSKGDVF